MANHIDAIINAIDRSIQNMNYYDALKRASKEYHAIKYPRPFIEWLEDFYGIEVEWDQDNNITRNYKVVDEQKYLLFQLKFYQ